MLFGNFSSCPHVLEQTCGLWHLQRACDRASNPVCLLSLYEQTQRGLVVEMLPVHSPLMSSCISLPIMNDAYD